jgi:hypothetical protein
MPTNRWSGLTKGEQLLLTLLQTQCRKTPIAGEPRPAKDDIVDVETRSEEAVRFWRARDIVPFV